MTKQTGWSTEQCAKHCAIDPSTWRAYDAEQRCPPALPDRDPVTGRKVWDPEVVRAWQANRDGQGARTDLADRYLPGVDGQQVYVSADTIAAADLLVELAGPDGSQVPRDELRARWLTEFPEDRNTAPVPPGTQARRLARQPRADGKPGRGDGRAGSAGTIAKKKIASALGALHKLGAIRREEGTVVLTDRALLAQIGAM